jgi:1,4-alpha-glucan branching enzyme
MRAPYNNREKSMITKTAAKKQGFVNITFELSSTMWAERVNLVGDFNEWDTTATPMTRSRSNANWKVTIELEAGRCYVFRYLVDGKEWLNDWHADDHVENPYGSYDSVLDLTDFGEPSS